jgi:hypothetical protein
MAGKKRQKVRSRDVEGLRYLQRLRPLLERLHDVGCERDRAGNRQLFFDDYCMLVLLYLFNPLVTSLRALQQASELQKVQRKLKCPRASLGSLSESADVFDASRLQEIIQELGVELQPIGRDARLHDVQHTLTLVDGTLITVLPRMMEASFLYAQKGKGSVRWRLHTHFEVDRYVPTRVDVTRDGGGDRDERTVMERQIESDHCYVMDKGYAKFTLFNQIHAADSSYVCRVRDNSQYRLLQSGELSEEAVAAGIIEDAVVELGVHSKPEARPDHPIRIVTIQVEPHEKRRWKGKTGTACDGYLRLATNMLDVPAEVIALIYRYRWTIEIFFRFFKHVLGCRHLLSHEQNGIEIQTYCAIIACMLISLWTGRKPTIRTYEMICYYFIGLASEAELLAHIDRLKQHDE